MIENQPRRLFLDTLVDFHEKIGHKSFWESWKYQDIVLEALMQDYFRAEHGEHLQTDAAFLEGALDAFGRRLIYYSIQGEAGWPVNGRN